MRILAIDPGLSGGACIYAPQFSIESGMRWQLIDIPTMGEKSQRRLNAAALRDFIVKFTPDHAFIESVSAWPGAGVSGMFRFGRAVGAIEAVIACCGVPLTPVIAQQWKRFHGIKGSDKEKSRFRALQLAPELCGYLSRKKDHGRAEAALIAIFGYNVELREQAA